MSTHLDESKLHHTHLQADCWRELREQVNKNTTALEQLNDRVSAVETRMTSVEDLQGALMQRLQLEVMERRNGSMTKIACDLLPHAEVSLLLFLICTLYIIDEKNCPSCSNTVAITVLKSYRELR